MGKGLQAKFYAFSFLGYIRSTLHTMMHTTNSPAELMKRVNQALMGDATLEDTFASLLLLRWEPEKNMVTYANAGHCRPVLAGPRGSEVITYSDIILGLDQDADFKDTSLVLNPGSAIIAYTDGILEQRMKSGEQLGEEGIIQTVESAYGLSEPVERIIERVMDDSEKREFGDDVLIFWLERTAVRERHNPRWFSPFSDISEGA